MVVIIICNAGKKNKLKKEKNHAGLPSSSFTPFSEGSSIRRASASGILPTSGTRWSLPPDVLKNENIV